MAPSVLCGVLGHAAALGFGVEGTGGALDHQPAAGVG